MFDFLREPWPWYVAGPLIGLIVPILLMVGNKSFGISANLRHACAIASPIKVDFFRYDWRSAGGWNLTFALGIIIGGFVAGILWSNPEPILISEATRVDLAGLGIHDFSGLMPREIFSFESLTSARGIIVLVLGGFLIGFGTAYAGGCTSGHAIMGLADLQLPSLLAVAGFFVGGLIMTHFLMPLIFLVKP